MSCAHLLAWDSEFFGCRIARIATGNPTDTEWLELRSWRQREAVECIYFLAEASDQPTLCRAADEGFRLLDIRVTLECDRLSVAGPAGLRRAGPADLPRLQQLTVGAFRDSRFARDSRLAPRADALYAAWIARDLGRDDMAVIVDATPDGSSLQGFVSCRATGKGMGEISLIAVAGEGRGKGIGTRLVHGALAHLRGAGCHAVQVVTNGANVPAIRLYERAGFLVHRLQVWHHYWAR